MESVEVFNSSDSCRSPRCYPLRVTSTHDSRHFLAKRRLFVFLDLFTSGQSLAFAGALPRLLTTGSPSLPLKLSLGGPVSRGIPHGSTVVASADLRNRETRLVAVKRKPDESWLKPSSVPPCRSPGRTRCHCDKGGGRSMGGTRLERGLAHTGEETGSAGSPVR